MMSNNKMLAKGVYLFSTQFGFNFDSNKKEYIKIGIQIPKL